MHARATKRGAIHWNGLGAGTGQRVPTAPTSRQHTLQGQPRDDTRGRQTGRAKEPAPQPDTWQFSCAAGGNAVAARKHEKHKKPSTAGSAILQPKSCGQRGLCGARALPQRPHSSRCPHAADAKPAEPNQPDCHPSQQREHAGGMCTKAPRPVSAAHYIQQSQAGPVQ